MSHFCHRRWSPPTFEMVTTLHSGPLQRKIHFLKKNTVSANYQLTFFSLKEWHFVSNVTRITHMHAINWCACFCLGTQLYLYLIKVTKAKQRSKGWRRNNNNMIIACIRYKARDGQILRDRWKEGRSINHMITKWLHCQKTQCIIMHVILYQNIMVLYHENCVS